MLRASIAVCQVCGAVGAPYHWASADPPPEADAIAKVGLANAVFAFRRRVIGLHSPAPQSGKSLVAGHLRRHGFMVVPFATALKDLARQLCVHLGRTMAEIDAALAGDKSQVVYNGVTMRRLLQTLGTEWGRQHLGPQVWIDCWRASANLLPACHIVADDVRFPNEAQAIRDLGGEVWMIVRPGAGVAQAHASEGQQIVCDHHLLNDSDPAHLFDQADQRLQGMA
jgi:hypothetical protein